MENTQTHQSREPLLVGERINKFFQRNGISITETYEVVEKISAREYTIKFVEMRAK